MRVLWANPAALWGLVLLTVPVLIHLLLRPRILRLRFPSLRFLPDSRLASARRRLIHDWPLLLVRMMILACAVVALAGPIFVTPAREQAWSGRIVRAIVVETRVGRADPSGVAAIVAREEVGVESALRIETPRLADGLIEAGAWLASAAPAAREIVVVSDFGEGSLSPRHLATLAPETGVRLLRMPAASGPAPAVRVLTLADGTLVEQQRTLGFGVAPPLSAPTASHQAAWPLRIDAAPAEHQLLAAAVNAVLGEGLLIEGEPVPVVLAWRVGDAPEPRMAADLPSSPAVREAFDRLVAAAGPSHAADGVIEEAPWAPVWPGRVAAAEHDGELLVMGRGALSVDDALRVARGAVRAVYAAPVLDAFSPRAIDAESLDGWARAAAPPDLTAVARAGESDAQWLWAVGLMLMAVEHWMRRVRRADAAPPVLAETEARVA